MFDFEFFGFVFDFDLAMEKKKNPIAAFQK